MPAINLAGVADLRRRFPELDLILIESGGDNLAATFSPELADLTIYVIDVSAGDKIPRKGGPGITRSDLLVINKIDLAPYVGASLEVMDRDAKKMRGERPFVFANIRAGKGVPEIAAFIERQGGLAQARSPLAKPAAMSDTRARSPTKGETQMADDRARPGQGDAAEADGRCLCRQARQGVYKHPIMEKFAAYTQEAVFGGLWTRPGLDLKTRALICVISDAATGASRN